MNYLFFSILIISQSMWTVFSSTDPAFKLSFPSEYKQMEKIIKTDMGDVTVKTVYCASYVDSTDNELYLLNYYKLNPNVFNGDSAITKEEFIKETIENIAKDINAEIIYTDYNISDDIAIATYRLENSKTAMKGKIVIENGYFYSLQVFTRKQYALNRNMDKFLDSFVISQTRN